MFHKLLARKRADFSVFYRQDAIHDFDNSGLCTQRIVKARKFDTDGTRPNYQKFFGHALGLQCMTVCPNQIAICLKLGKFAGTRAGGQYNIFGLESFLTLFAGHFNGLRTRQTRLTHEGGDFVFLHQVINTLTEPFCDRPRTGCDCWEVIVNIFRTQTKFAGSLHEVKHFGRTQHRFGWNTSPIKANAAHVFSLNNGNVQAQLCRANCSHIPARTSANNYKIESM